MSDKTFIDTNILIYAHDVDAGLKHARACALIRSLWETRQGVLSIQVLQEFYVNVTRKIATPLGFATARGLIETYRVWQVEIGTIDTVLRATEIQERHQLSFWDALIIAAATQGGATLLLSEDLNHGQSIEGVQVRNPFLSS